MSIQTGEGAIRIDADDPQFTHRGIQLAIKVRVIMWPVILLCKRKVGESGWTVDSDLTGDWFSSDVANEPDVVGYCLKSYGSAAALVKELVMPNLSTALARLFGAGVAVPPLEQIHAALNGIKWEPQADGTLKATMP